jgi:hypothetical protein
MCGLDVLTANVHFWPLTATAQIAESKEVTLGNPQDGATFFKTIE